MGISFGMKVRMLRRIKKKRMKWLSKKVCFKVHCAMMGSLIVLLEKIDMEKR